MVDEFSSFARMPQPVLKPMSLAELVRGQISLYDHGKIAFSFAGEDGAADNDFIILGDAGLLRQALTNLIQNAVDSLEGAKTTTPEIALSLEMNEGMVQLLVQDNGPGFPEMDLDQLLEPYVTNRDKGTGLGLAIVSKVIQDHAGSLSLSAGQEGGAEVILRFPTPDSQLTSVDVKGD